MAPYRILVVDDSAFMRKIISDLIVSDPQFIVIATASNGQDAVEAVQELKPDAITMDLEMPIMNGIEALQQIMSNHPIPVIMLSGISEDNTKETIKALQFGAFDFIRKPSSAFSNDIHQVGEALIEKLRIAVLLKRHQPVITIQEREEAKKDRKNEHLSRNSTKSNHIVSGQPDQKLEKPPNVKLPAPSKEREMPTITPVSDKQSGQKAVNSSHTKPNEIVKDHKGLKKPASSIAPQQEPIVHDQKVDVLRRGIESVASHKPKSTAAVTSFRHIIAIGTSTGGPRALHEVISTLPGDLPAPVLVVQHMPPKFTKSLAQRLDNFSALRVVEAEQGERVYAGVVYIAPGGFHMELAKDSSGYYILLTEQPIRNGHRPSVDVLFESLTAFSELKRHAVIMTGMGSDGTKGMKKLVENGIDSTFAEAEETCVVYGMPRSAIEAGFVNKIVPLQHIASQIVQAVLINRN